MFEASIIQLIFDRVPAFGDEDATLEAADLGAILITTDGSNGHDASGGA